jgi:hypothetical protein
MRRHPTVPICIWVMLCVSPAAAQEPPCPAVTIEVDESLTARWPELVDRVREALGQRDDIDRCAHVGLTERAPEILVQVVLPDGRSAARPVSRREDIIPTLAALLLVPLASAEAQTAREPMNSTPTPPASSLPAPSARAPLPTARRDPSASVLAASDSDVSAASPPRAVSRFRIELSALTGARFGDGQTALGLGAFSFLDLSGWLLGFEGRWDRYQARSPGTPTSSALELALLAGHRFRFRDTALDLIAGPAAVLQGTTTFTQPATMGGGETSGSSSSTAPRLVLAARVNFNARSTLYPFVGMDAEIGPTRASDGDPVPDAPRLPIWTLGLALGATVGTK